MPTVTESQPSQDRTQIVGCYIYGIVPGDVEPTSAARGIVGAQVKPVRHREIAALVSEVKLDRPLGDPEDLMAHEQLLDSIAAAAPVLPVRFGGVVASEDAVVKELLAPHHDEFLAALNELEGRTEWAVKGRYVERVILSEVLTENAQAARLREEIRGKPDEVTRNLQIQLGEMINQAIALKRETDTRQLVEHHAPYCVASSIREPTHELDAVHVAFLVENARQKEFEDALNQLAGQWSGRMTLRLLGPLAPYDFVVTTKV